MPNSFSRFLTPKELARVRAVYLDSLESAQAAAADSTAEPAPEGPPEPPGDTVDG